MSRGWALLRTAGALARRGGVWEPAPPSEVARLFPPGHSGFFVPSRVRPSEPTPPEILHARRALRGIPRRSAAGVDACPGDFLRELARGDHLAGAALSRGVAALAGAVSRGAFHPRGRLLLLTAKIVPIAKSDGGTRPIAILPVVVRVAIALQVSPAARRAAPALRSFGQLAIRSRSACERIADAVQAAHSGGAVVALIDRRNAYGCVDRGAVRAAVAELLGDTLPLFDFIYGDVIPLSGHIPPGTVASQGVLQGDPLAPLVFAAFAAWQARRLMRPDVRLLHFLDDIVVIAPTPELLWPAVDALERDDAAAGLAFVPQKCATNTPPPPSRAAWRAFGADAATKCLGIPVGGAAPRADAFSAVCARAGAAGA